LCEFSTAAVGRLRPPRQRAFAAPSKRAPTATTTDDKTNLSNTPQKTSDANLLRKMIGFADNMKSFALCVLD
jgi:hypothetical protein